MRITHLGHASLLCEVGGVRILFDPLFIDPHQEGTLTVFPERTIDLDQLPPHDVLVLTHHHLDHFDPATLARLRRDVEVLIPRSAAMQEALRRLGYESIHPLDANVSVDLGGATLITTASDVPFPEIGVVLRDAGGTVWNQVDTIVGAAEIDEVLRATGGIDLAIAPWQPMLETAAARNEPMQFPTLAYGQRLADLARLGPRAVIAGACGFRYDAAPWLNSVVFPQSVERFLDDVVRMMPELSGSVFEINPGDVFEVRDGSVMRQPAAAFIRRTPRDPFALEFSPPPAERVGAAATSGTDEERAAVHELCTNGLTAYVASNEAAFAAHRQWQVVLQIEIVWPEGSDFFVLDFREPSPRCHRGRTPMTNFFCRVAGCALAVLLGGGCTWERLIAAGAFHQHHRIYGIWSAGIVPPIDVRIENPLLLMLPDEANYARMLDRELDRLTTDIPAVSS
ncbi:MAG TPA: MBL fold metallo-hydrolase [Thermoanaerobaculia bacterium]|nr:MBL fold metallo-hydrolase [Thermoanaerobaculia bacterium]